MVKVHSAALKTRKEYCVRGETNQGSFIFFYNNYAEALKKLNDIVEKKSDSLHIIRLECLK